MGVTDLRPYFTQIISHNFMTVHRIVTKHGTEMRLNKSFKCAKFHPDSSTHSCFMADFAKCAKRSRRRKKNEEKTPHFGRLYIGNSLSNFLKIWNVDSPT